MKKKSISLMLALLCLLTVLTGCGSKKKEIDLQTLPEEIMKGAAFTDKLDALDAGVIPILYAVDTADYSDARVYAGTAATAEEIAVFQAVDAAAADRLLKAVQTRVDKQLEVYKSYGPAAAMSLENAITAKSGNYVIMVICSDSAGAKKVVEQYF